jgi:hypothetical protein
VPVLLNRSAGLRETLGTEARLMMIGGIMLASFVFVPALFVAFERLGEAGLRLILRRGEWGRPEPHVVRAPPIGLRHLQLTHEGCFPLLA